MAIKSAPIRRLTGAALIAGVALAAPAARAAGPVRVTGQRTIDASPVGLAFDGAGRAVASWRAFVGKPSEGEQHHVFAITDRAGRWRSPVTLRGTVLEHELAVTGRRAAFAVWRQVPAGRRHSRSVIKLIVVDTASGAIRRVHRLAVGPPQRIDPEGTPATLLSPRVAATPNGSLVVAWVRSTPHKAGVWVTTARPNGRFDTPRRIGPLGGSPMLSIAGDGRGVIAWQRGHRIQARVRRATGTWGPIERAATTIGAVTWGVDSIDAAAADGRQFAEDVAGAPDGSFAAVWFAGDTVGLTEVDAAGTAHPSADLATERPLRGAKVAIDPRSGRMVAVWSQGTALGYRPVAWTK